MHDDAPSGEAQHWLLLIHQLPAKPAYLRVKVWRRLQGLGAVAVKNAVYALPASERSQEDFAWLLKEIAEGGGEALVCQARLIDGLSDGAVRGLFDAARDADYDAIADEARTLARTLGPDGTVPGDKRAEARTQVARLRRRLAEVVSLDFFGANGCEPAEGLLSELEARVVEEATMAGEPEQAIDLRGNQGLKGRTWVTRQGVHVDRIASAWLIRRFIDPEARFKFVPSRGYKPAPDELRFDMFEAEFTHQGDRCTFEGLLARTGLTDPALQAIAEIVHDIDLKDGKFSRDDAPGVSHLVAGIAMATRDDRQRIARGEAVLDDLYRYFRAKRGGSRRPG